MTWHDTYRHTRATYGQRRSQTGAVFKFLPRSIEPGWTDPHGMFIGSWIHHYIRRQLRLQGTGFNFDSPIFPIFSHISPVIVNPKSLALASYGRQTLSPFATALTNLPICPSSLGCALAYAKISSHVLEAWYSVTSLRYSSGVLRDTYSNRFNRPFHSRRRSLERTSSHGSEMNLVRNIVAFMPCI